MKSVKKIRLVQSASIAAIALYSSMPAFAQEQRPEEGAIGDIIVTAQRRSENVLKVPVSVTVVSSDQLIQRGANDLSAVTKLAPSLQVAQDNTFSVRGVGTATFANTVEASVSQVVDDVVLGNREFASNAFYDVARVEVLNGPQGLLFGKNASAGLVNITTNKPKLGEMSFSADGELVQRERPGDNGTGYQLRSTLNLPMGDRAALRFNAIYSDQDPITVSNVNPAVRNDLGLKNVGLRAKLLFEPTDNLSIYVIGDYNLQRGITGRYDITFREFGSGSQYPARGLVAGEDNLNFAAEAPNYRDSGTGGIQANISLTFPNGMELSSISAWKEAKSNYQFDSDQTPFNFFSYNSSDQKYDQYSQELRLALPSGNPLSGQFGLYYFHSSSTADGFRGGNNGVPDFVAIGFPFCIGATVTAGPPPACGVSNTSFLGQDYDYRLKQNSYAGFGQLSYQVTDTVKLTAGARLTYEKARIALQENFGQYFVTLGVPQNVSNESTDATDLSYKVGVDWQATPDLMVYGFYGEGFKGPGFSNTSPAPNAELAVRPEISRGGELGVKGKALDGAVTFSLSGFYTKFYDLQVQAFVQSLRTFVLSNAATATTKGVDFSFQAHPFDGLTLSGSAAYVDARFNDYPGAQCFPTQTTDGCKADINSSLPDFVGTFNAKGYRLPLSSRFTAALGAEYAAPISDSLEAQFGVGYYHRSPQSGGIGAAFTIPTWDTIDLRAGLKANNWTISLFCKNCTNEVRPISIGSDGGDANPVGTADPVLTLNQRFSFDSVRTIGVRAGVNF
ncbi:MULTISPECIES: TonB-dependent receptor [Novosphingobium]|uniref:Iron complex outermembrane recepter protein n=1 Tax=Novosphingobium mathurense TaxID=428990 RepID=A0A1U6IML3_9SPHN|nr:MULTISPECIES: TonB-dependent receptor [Novosphingobium]CDO37955.1 TonB-dependent receptor [Novosphingobium sp. KN65.2]SLK09268.1 iron complex outermembrane recepter protein [Novosphingobium mathurense]